MWPNRFDEKGEIERKRVVMNKQRKKQALFVVIKRCSAAFLYVEDLKIL